MNDTAIAEAAPVRERSLVTKFADRYSINPSILLTTLKATAFKQARGEPVTNEQMVALLVVADQYRLNPFTKEIYAFPDKKNGIVPVVGVDGWSRLINSAPEFDGMDFEMLGPMEQRDEHAQPCPEAIACVMYRKDRGHPIRVIEYFDECYRPPFKSNDGYVTKGPWQTHTKRMLRHKAMIQCARAAFGFVGIYDEDEGERIVEAPSVDGGTIIDSTQAGTAADLADALSGESSSIEEAEYIDPAETETPDEKPPVADAPEWMALKEDLLDKVSLAQSLSELDAIKVESEEGLKGPAKAAVTKAINERESELQG